MIDLLIIGGGPAGYVAAERAGERGLNVVLFEKKAMGGVCLNEGCIPTKTLLYSAKMYDNALEATKYGVFAENVSFDYAKMVSRKKKVVRKLVLGIESKMKLNNVKVVKGEAYINGRSSDGIEVISDGEKYIGKNLIVATGSESLWPPIPGLNEAGDLLLTNREILEMDRLPKSLVVIGGGVIGMEFASFYNSLGTKVTIIEMLPEIIAGMDLEISSMLRNIYMKKGIEFILDAKVTEVDGNSVVYEKDGKRASLEGDKILLSVGRRPNIEGFGLENLNVELHRNGIKVDERMRTNVPGLFAAGDVTGFSLFAHTASREGEVIINNLTGRDDVMRYNAVPAVIYTAPEVAGVGETEESAREKNIAFKVAKLPMAYSGRFVAENEGGIGLCKVLIGEKYGEVIGVHMLGSPASEIIYGAVMAIEQEMTLKEMQEIIFPHPTVSEIFRETVFSFK